MRGLSDAYERLSKDNIKQSASAQQTVARLQKKVDQQSSTFDKFMEKFNRLEKKHQLISKERDSLKLKNIVLVNKTKNRATDIDIFKLCRHCGLEYSEKENFNWSCRQHTSVWGGSVWWCCGKTDKNNLGCKFDKHREKADEEHGDDEDDEERGLKLENQKCQCCKRKGHTAKNCDLDPNFKTVVQDI